MDQHTQILGMSSDSVDKTEDGTSIPDDVPLDDLGASGLLTRADREYLLGRRSYANGNQERKARKRLRERIRTGLQDFALLLRYMDGRDMAQILGDINPTIREQERIYRQAELQGAINAIAFLYTITYRVDLPFEMIVEQGLMEAQSSDFFGPFSIAGVDVSIEETRRVDTAAAVGKIGDDADLTMLEYFELKRLLIDDLERFLEYTEDIETALERRETANGRLSRGESLVVLARGMQSPSRIDPVRAADLLHERVVADFNLPVGSGTSAETGRNDEPSPEAVAEDLPEDSGN